MKCCARRCAPHLKRIAWPGSRGRSWPSIDARLATLTSREHEVLKGVIAGQLNKQIAGDLGTVEHTIKVHRARVMEKMKVQSVAELVRLVDRARTPGR